ncbi:site-specific integrase [Chryseobacterium sp. LC2016-29]|uniref:tyrosine-type recombinase/integrase n=1 Tax=Chryseobacterium sp. LC2016-29 TaxID=2897331 RepID=UPI001E283AB0|nr:tyrosine-type recombinase/integrase [Chryseobacterium sp. LC2016-29]MCD0478048.1 site-specific integrase [Chryseobacterium sp. LC2016-29]
METFKILELFRKKLIIQQYSLSSIKNYCSVIQQFLMIAFKKQTNVSEISLIDIENFIFSKIEKYHISISYQITILSSIAKFYKLLYNKDINLKYLYPKREEQKLPNFLTKKEVKKLLNSIQNLKHKAILTTIYACGLRLCELLEIKISDMKFKDFTLIIRQGINEKARTVNLSPKLINILEEYYNVYHPKKYLFEGKKESKYSKRSVQQILKNALKTSNITSTATVYTLRHSYAIHLLESGTDVRFIKELLGHKDIKTTEIYTIIANVQKNNIISPLDFL